MYVILAPIQIKEGFKESFIEAMIADAEGSMSNESGCLRFDVIQDSENANRIWLYEVYENENAFQAHTQAPHFKKWAETVKDWRGEGLTGAARGSYNIWPPDDKWE